MMELETSRQVLEVIPRIMRLIRTEMRQYAKGQLTIPQFRILIKLTHQPMTHKEVAEWLGVTPATLTRMIDTLVKRKLAIRETCKKDRRQIFLSPTPQGKLLAERYKNEANDWIREKINTLSNSEKTKLREGLKILHDLFPDA